ncbi:hypothetical protein DP939_00225 [Spongiactinospora rosea]|uniref:Uncharacterized protein n=1 Tax=Spongiactinospora rosea TaxID=2248750 RepID=A0A366M8I6_9ACTN|nr:hypothetical protein [Spongiactinospora rosea]RBQ22133.1 hypothetical protein DP939_00225 [Spongiactinospora rosea]
MPIFALIARVAAGLGLLAAGWLLAVLFGLLGAAPAAADSIVSDGGGVDSSHAFGDMAGFNAEAMAGRGVDGLTSQSEPALPTPITTDHNSGADGFVPQGGGGPGQFVPGMGDLARSGFDPQLAMLRAPAAGVLPPVVRTAADEPSFSPD